MNNITKYSLIDKIMYYYNKDIILLIVIVIMKWIFFLL